MSDRTGAARKQPDQVVFIRAPRPVAEEDQYARPMGDVKDAWRAITKQLAEIMSATDSSMTGKYKLTEVAVGLKISAKGSFFGIVESAAEASIVVKIVPK